MQNNAVFSVNPAIVSQTLSPFTNESTPLAALECSGAPSIINLACRFDFEVSLFDDFRDMQKGFVHKLFEFLSRYVRCVNPSSNLGI